MVIPNDACGLLQSLLSLLLGHLFGNTTFFARITFCIIAYWIRLLLLVLAEDVALCDFLGLHLELLQLNDLALPCLGQDGGEEDRQSCAH